MDYLHQVISIGSITSVWWIQLSTTVISGLAFSTLLTLVLTPVMLSLPSNVIRLCSRKSAKVEQSDADQKISKPGRKKAKGDDQKDRWQLPDAAE
jgi:multidrug efflux pump